MPEEIAHEPFLSQGFTSEVPLKADFFEKYGRLIDSLPSDRLAYYFLEASNQSLLLKDKLVNKYPDYPEEKIEAVLDLVYGFNRLKRETLASTTGEISEDEKKISALIQHNLVHHIIHATTRDADPTYVRAIYQLVRTHLRIADKMGFHEGQNLRLCWAGVRNEAAFVSALLNDGYRVFVPDYLQGEVDDKDDESLSLDVRRGIDLIAVRDHVVFLIDVKGREMHLKAGERTIGDEETVLACNLKNVIMTAETEESVKKAVLAVEPNPVRICKATVGLRSEFKFAHQDLREEEKGYPGQRDFLNSFVGLQDELDEEVCHVVNELRRFSWANMLPMTNLKPFDKTNQR